MSDSTSGPADERPTGRFRRPPDEDWTPEDMPLGHHTPRDPLPEERLPGEPPPGATSRLPGSIGPGRNGLTADDLTPEDTPPHPPGPGYESPMPDDGLGVPSSGEVTGREAHTTESRAPDAWPTAPGGTGAPGTPAAAAGAPAPGVGEPAPAPSGTGAPLLPHDETARWEQRMRQLAVGFVDEPRGAVEQADHVLEEIAERFEEAVERRRRTLRRSWEASEDRGPGTDTDTEQLRLALRDYQELAGRLLHI
ncbi:hypothetical protein FB563_4541 [Streptomyces puniciscabiei]|uniref:Uncharacterized protein n=1 Tax=Streptomyces puniciscabiei TaxID=164348 RepID=A0A542UK73_9ACTN|nr:hypothetical protein [Streptomyces puniciscabiei]TQK99465.1 hypothetical protein FB563_4541 [Streptomyces puniciscabiei]